MLSRFIHLLQKSDIMKWLNLRRHFVIADGVRGVRIKGLFLKNGAAPDGAANFTDGGCVVVRENASLSLINVSLTNCRAGSRGGAIFVGKNSTLEVKGSAIFSSSAERGGGVFASENSSFEVISSAVGGNAAGVDGGGVHALSSSTIELREGASVSNNTAVRHGGGLYVEETNLTVVSSAVDGNAAGVDGGGVHAILSSTVELREGASVSNNTVPDDGGGLYVAKGTTLKVINSSVDGNTAGASVRPPCLGWGGGVCALRDASVELREDASVKSNTATCMAGGLYVQDSKLTVISSAVDGNTASFNGGGVGAIRATMELREGASVSNNVAASDDGPYPMTGGGLYVQTSTLIVINSAVDSNTAGDLGGGMYAVVNAAVELREGASVSNNTAAAKHYHLEQWKLWPIGLGGGLCVEESTLTVVSSAVDGNAAGVDGGGVSAVLSSTVELREGASVSNNTAAHNGGGLYVATESQLATNGTTHVRSNTARTGSGGGILAYTSAALTLGGDLHLDSNTAGEDGGACALAQASSLTGAAHTGRHTIALRHNSALRNGGGLAVSDGSTVSLPATVLVLSDNTAGRHGGGLFAAASPLDAQASTCDSNASSAVEFRELHLTGNTATAGDGGGLFSSETVTLLAGGRTNATGNAAVQGGAVALSDADLVVQSGHSLEAVHNTAQQHGGAAALLSGATLSLEAGGACPSKCTEGSRRDRVCSEECMSASCNWDHGACVQTRMRTAGENARQACDRETCNFLHQTGGSENDGCSSNCFSASCDWSRDMCVDARSHVRTCPLIDAAAFASLRGAQGQQPHGTPKFLVGGNSQGSFGRCNSSCTQPAGLGMAEASVLRGLGRVGGAGAALTGNGSQHMWLHAALHNANVSADGAGGDSDAAVTGGFTVESWIQVPSECCANGRSDFGFVVASADYAVAIRRNDTSFWPLFFWTTAPAAQQCAAGPVTLTSSSGAISDGPGLLPRGSTGSLVGPASCVWILAPGGAAGGFQDVTLFFTEFLLTTKDLLSLYSCFDVNCTAKSAAMEYKGANLPPPFVSSTPVMMIELNNNQEGARASSRGFTASFAATPLRHEGGTRLESGVWYHVAYIVSPVGMVTLFVNGTLNGTQQQPENLTAWSGTPSKSPLTSGGFATALGRGAPAWQDGGGFGYSCVALDEIRLWSRARAAANISADLLVGCASLGANAANAAALTACYSFDMMQSSATGPFFPDSSTNSIPAYAAPHGSRFQPTCVNVDDGGELQLLDKVDDGYEWSATQMWGYCTSKPRLPGAGFDYREQDMQVAAAHSLEGTAGVLGLYPGCGVVPMLLEHNSAGKLGGAIYYDGCHRLDKMCFVQGIGPLSGSRAILLRHNQAQSGGAVYVECHMMGAECRKAFDANNTIGALPDLPKVEFTGSYSSFYGDKLATQPASMTWLPKSPEDLEVVPSRLLKSCDTSLAGSGVPANAALLLTFAVQPFDDLGSGVRGVDDNVQIRLCSTTGKCNQHSALLPVTFLPLNPSTGVASASLQVECARGEESVAVEVSLAGFVDVPRLRALVRCGKCRAGESKTEDSTTGTWFCRPCSANQYVSDPNNAAHSCQDCPAGGTCSDGSFIANSGSVWDLDRSTGAYSIVSCSAGAAIVSSPYLQQACRPCAAGFYCAGGSDPALKCPKDTFSEPMSRSQDACVESQEVALTVNLPMSAAEFTQEKQMVFKESIAEVAGVKPSFVEITDIAQVSTRRNASRTLLAASIEVMTRIRTISGDAEEIVNRLDEDTINAQLAKNGLPEGQVTRKASKLQPANLNQNGNDFLIVGVLVSVGIVTIIAIVAWLLKKTRNHEKTEKKRREEARRRVEIRKKEFERRLNLQNERDMRADARKKKKEAKDMTLKEIALHSSVSDYQGIHTIAGDKCKEPETQAASPTLLTSIDEDSLEELMDDIEAGETKAASHNPDQTVKALLAQEKRLQVSSVAATMMTMPLPGSVSGTSDIDANEDELLKSLHEVTAGEHLTVNRNGDSQEETLHEPGHKAPDQRTEGSDAKLLAGHLSSLEANAKFEAHKLVLGKAHQSVLTSCIGLNRTKNAVDLAKPLEAMEREFFPFGFFPLEKEPSDDFDHYYRQDLSEITTAYNAGEIDQDEYRDELERIRDEFQDRKYKWWLAGANFDYVRYGEIGDPATPGENFWLPPHVLRSFQVGKYHGGSIEASDYDTGHYDLPGIVLKLDLDYEQTGRQDSKGEENTERKDFKRRIAQDLAQASPIFIAAADCPVVGVSSCRDGEAGVLVDVHILPSLKDKRGPDECWKIADSFCKQGRDESSLLMTKGELTKHVFNGGVGLSGQRSRQKMTLMDFANLTVCKLAGLELHHLLAIRLYTSDSYPFFNNPLRQEIKPHPLMFSVYFLDQALRQLTTVEALLRPSEYNRVKYLWRGMKNMMLDAEDFFAEGGTELAPMSTTEDLNVALHYSKSEVPLIYRYEARGRSRGVDIGFASLYPKEKEYLYAPLTGLILLKAYETTESELQEMQSSIEHQTFEFGKQQETQMLRAVLRRFQEKLDKLSSKRAIVDANERKCHVYDVRPMR